MAQWVRQPTLDFGSGHDITVLGIEAHVGLCAVHAEPALGSLSPSLPLSLSLSLSASPVHACTDMHTLPLSLKVNRLENIRIDSII